MVQVVVYLSSEHNALSSNPSTTKKKKNAKLYTQEDQWFPGAGEGRETGEIKGILG
jgi:hypothetical protein